MASSRFVVAPSSDILGATLFNGRMVMLDFILLFFVVIGYPLYKFFRLFSSRRQGENLMNIFVCGIITLMILVAIFTKLLPHISWR